MVTLSLFAYPQDYFNPSPSTTVHIDLNSCFATVEQQANPLLRGKPVAVAAYTTPRGCIIAPSVEAKKLGINLGMRVRDGKKICPSLIVLAPDPWKYRFVNKKLLHLFKSYTDKIKIKSIDEMVLDFKNTPILEKESIWNIAHKIKFDIKKNIGDWLTVSIGIGPSMFLAKTASNLQKPDGLNEINYLNFKKIYKKMRVEKLCGIKKKTAEKLNNKNIFTVFDMYSSTSQKLKSVFCSVVGYYWYFRLRGIEIDNIEFARKSFGNSYALNKFTSDRKILSRILYRLVEKMGKRLRKKGYGARGVHLSFVYTDYTYWQRAKTIFKKSTCKKNLSSQQQTIYSSSDFYKYATKILHSSPEKKVRIIAVSCFNLVKNPFNQLTLLLEEKKKRKLTFALDKISERFGELTVFPANTITTKGQIIDRVAFGSIREIEEFCISYFTSKVPSSLQ